MGTRVGILGLGQIGTSVGLALGAWKKTFERIGYDPDPAVTKQAARLDALDMPTKDIFVAAEQAELLVLCLPTNEVYQVLELLAPKLKEGAIVLDTSPVRSPAADWVKQLFPQGCHYAGFLPLLNPTLLHDPAGGVEAASAELFQSGLVAILPAPGTSPTALELVTNFTERLGAQPFFPDLWEVDGIMAAVHLLPQLVSAVLTNATVDQPGWQEARKFAGRAYAQTTSAILNGDPPLGLASATLLNKENLLRALDGVLAELNALRTAISQDDLEQIVDHLHRARLGRQQWWQQRLEGDWQSEHIPTKRISTGDVGMMIGLARKLKKYDEDQD